MRRTLAEIDDVMDGSKWIELPTVAEWFETNFAKAYARAQRTLGTRDRDLIMEKLAEVCEQYDEWKRSWHPDHSVPFDAYMIDRVGYWCQKHWGVKAAAERREAVIVLSDSLDKANEVFDADIDVEALRQLTAWMDPIFDHIVDGLLMGLNMKEMVTEEYTYGRLRTAKQALIEVALEHWEP